MNALAALFQHPGAKPRRGRQLARLLGAGTSALALALFACPAESSAATIVASAVGSGGSRQTSATYTADGVIGGTGGLAAADTTLIRHGFAGQLYEVQGLALSASPTTVNEATTRQLNAAATLDDATLLALSPTNAAWSVVSGAITSVSAGGLALAANVYQGSPATVRAEYQATFGTLSLTVLNVGEDDFGTYAGDGLEDAWQVQYFGLNDVDASPTADPDGDGQSNLFEYLAATVPTNSASSFRLTISPPTTAQPSIVFSPRVSTRSYTVEYVTDLVSGGFATLTTAQPSDDGSTRTVVDLGATNAMRFYRIRISRP